MVRIVGVACIAIIVAVLWTALGAADQRQHMFGQSTRTHATVVGEERAGRCRVSAPQTRHAYTLEWREGGRARTEVIERCGRPYDVGESVEIWSRDGMPFTESALVRQLTVGGAVVVFTGLVVLMVLVEVFLRRRHPHGPARA